MAPEADFVDTCRRFADLSRRMTGLPCGTMHSSSRWVGCAGACGRLPAPSGAVRGVRGAAGGMGLEADKAAG